MPISQRMQKCTLDAAHKCTRCGEQYDHAFDDNNFATCKEGECRTVGFMFYCPGCKHAHPFHTVDYRTALTGHANPTWSFNGDMEKPTFSPSLQVNKPGQAGCCHLHVVDGIILYANDGGTAHELKGKQVPLEEFKWHEAEAS